MLQGKKLCLIMAFATAVGALAPTLVVAQGLFHREHKVGGSTHQDVTVRELAAIIDNLDKELFEEGMIAIKAPDVWGQNRMTKYRAEYEKEMAAQVNQFTFTLNAAMRRADTAVFTSATSIGAAIQPRAAGGRRGTTSTPAAASSAPSTTVVMAPSTSTATSAPSAADPATKVDIPANPGGVAQPLLDSISALVDKNATNLSQLPSSILPNGPIAIEPNIGLDERDNYLNHLQQLRRTNSGDDLTDAPGYGLYLVRIPISLLPGPEVRKGYGAMVSVEAKHALSPDLLPNMFRDVAIMDTAYQINPILLKLAHGVTLNIRSDSPTATARTMQHPRGSQGPMSAAPSALNPGNFFGVSPSVPFSESPEIYGIDELNVLLTSAKGDLADSYRHDPSILSWLINELGSAHRFMREQARNGALADMFSAERFQTLDLFVQQRNYDGLSTWRNQFIAELVTRRKGANYTPGSTINVSKDALTTDVLVYALMVQSVLVDRQLKHDMDVVSQRKSCACADLTSLTFYDLFPSPEARQAFNAYVACKWPLHVFAIDPAVEQQNQLDLFSARSEFQAAIAVALASGNINFDQATKFARRLETDIDTIALNRTAVGYGAGDSTFGWQFYPRIQSPPTPGNIRRIAGLIGGTSYNQNYIAKNRFIEPGPRECVALIVAPNFIPAIQFTSFGNWFEYTGKHADMKFDTGDVLEFSRKIQTAKIGLNHVCDGDNYRPGEIARLSGRIAQLEAKLPSQDFRVPLPFEGDLTGSEVFSSSGARLAPRLVSWFGEPARVGKPSTIFLLGTSFSVHETQVIAGGLTVAATDMKLISRNVMMITIAPEARPVQTNDGRTIFDVHIATPNGISNHLIVEASAPPSVPPAAPAFGYALKTGALAVAYGVWGRVDGDPAHPGVASLLDTDPKKLVLSWLEPVGLAPNLVDVTFSFPNLLPITVSGLKPDNGGQIVIGGQDFQKLAQGILDRLQATAVTFDPVRNPTPLKPITADSIVVTPTTGTHAEQDVTASGALTVSFSAFATPPTGAAVNGTSQLRRVIEPGSGTALPPLPALPHRGDAVLPPSRDETPRSISPVAPTIPSPNPGIPPAAQRSILPGPRGAVQPSRVNAPTRAITSPPRPGSAGPLKNGPVSSLGPNPAIPTTPKARPAFVTRSSIAAGDPTVGRNSTTGPGRTMFSKVFRNEP